MYSLKLLNSLFSSTGRKYKRMRKKMKLTRIDNIKNATFANHIVPEGFTTNSSPSSVTPN